MKYRQSLAVAAQSKDLFGYKHRPFPAEPLRNINLFVLVLLQFGSSARARDIRRDGFTETVIEGANAEGAVCSIAYDGLLRLCLPAQARS